LFCIHNSCTEPDTGNKKESVTVKIHPDSLAFAKNENRVKNYRTVQFTNVNCLLLIDYPQRISSGGYFYKKYSITPGEREFEIKGTLRSGQTFTWKIPYTKEEMPGHGVPEDSILGLPVFSEHFVSEKETYSINDTIYIIYKHHDYNCYDPMCGAKHGHMPVETGITWFSPEFGILVNIDNQNMQFNLMASMQEKNVPHELVIKILEKEKAEQRIIRHYIQKVNFKSSN
jgi:hypothetical protein